MCTFCPQRTVIANCVYEETLSTRLRVTTAITNTSVALHDRIREHLNNKNSSVKNHISSCQNKDYKGFEIKSIVHENDPANLRLLEAFYS